MFAAGMDEQTDEWSQLIRVRSDQSEREGGGAAPRFDNWWQSHGVVNNVDAS